MRKPHPIDRWGLTQRTAVINQMIRMTTTMMMSTRPMSMGQTYTLWPSYLVAGSTHSVLGDVVVGDSVGGDEELAGELEVG